MTRIITAEEAAALLEGATPGPWRRSDESECGIKAGRRTFVVDSTMLGSGRQIISIRPADADLIIAAPDLARTVVELEKERDRLQRLLTKCGEIARANVASLSNDQTELESVALLSEHCGTAMDERDRLRARLRHVAQTLIDVVGADGPMDAEDTAQRAVAALAERDRLRDILDCETGNRAPEGWESCFAVEYEGDDESREMPYLTLWRRSAAGIHCFAGHSETTHPKRWWSVLDRRSKPKLIGSGEADTMLEAIEAADRAAKENG